MKVGDGRSTSGGRSGDAGATALPGQTRFRYNCGRCGYLALSSPHEDTEKGTETHRCPECGEQWWLDEATYAAMVRDRA